MSRVPRFLLPSVRRLSRHARGVCVRVYARGHIGICQYLAHPFTCYVVSYVLDTYVALRDCDFRFLAYWPPFVVCLILTYLLFAFFVAIS